MSHSAHPDVHEAGLADGCPDCALAAGEPWLYLDREALADLLDRTLRNRFGTFEVDGRPADPSPFGDSVAPRSDAEAVAMGRLLTQLEVCGQLAQAAPAKLGLYLARRWRAALPAPLA